MTLEKINENDKNSVVRFVISECLHKLEKYQEKYSKFYECLNFPVESCMRIVLYTLNVTTIRKTNFNTHKSFKKHEKTLNFRLLQNQGVNNYGMFCMKSKNFFTD